MILHAIVLALCEIVGFLFGPSIIYSRFCIRSSVISGSLCHVCSFFWFSRYYYYAISFYFEVAALLRSYVNVRVFYHTLIFTLCVMMSSRSNPRYHCPAFGCSISHCEPQIESTRLCVRITGTVTKVTKRKMASNGNLI